MGGAGGARGVRPGAVEDDVVGAVGPGDADGGDGGGGPEVAVGAEEFVLCRLVEDRADLEGQPRATSTTTRQMTGRANS
ncbi:hypothetical protein [Streptomyces pseudovenezuelae]|uniref:hypothetical protein n=2 Tax=Streptomyces pseudovenezuelae TaxID=67350 RepID=UPI002E35C51A|nr:hypothetical protein [Streptomyces pseudovenezuelae]